MKKNNMKLKTDADRIIKDITHRTFDEIEELYGIVIDEDAGTVFDPMYNKTFSSIYTWAEYSAEYESDDDYHRQTKWTDDEDM